MTTQTPGPYPSGVCATGSVTIGSGRDEEDTTGRYPIVEPYLTRRAEFGRKIANSRRRPVRFSRPPPSTTRPSLPPSLAGSTSELWRVNPPSQAYITPLARAWLAKAPKARRRPRSKIRPELPAAPTRIQCELARLIASLDLIAARPGTILVDRAASSWNEPAVSD